MAVSNKKIQDIVDDWISKQNPPPTTQQITAKTVAVTKQQADIELSGKGNTSSDDGAIAKAIKASADTDQYASVNSNTSIEKFAELYTQAKKEGGNPIEKFFSGLQGVASNQGETYAKEQVYMLRQINQEMGLTGQFSKDFRDSLNDTIPELQKLGLGVTDVVESTKEMVENSGKFAFISSDSQVKAAQIATAFGMTMKELAGSYKSFEDVGIGAVGAAEAIGDAGKESLELGLQSQTTIKGLQDNVDKLNQFGFQKGIRGLEEMVRKSTEFRMSVDSVFQVADKVFSPEGALEMAANLQVVGGAMGALNNPLEMMYMATNNVEGLQDAIFKSTESLATFNNETGRFEVVGVNLRKAKDMADATGISLSELTKGAIAGNERMQAMNDMSGIDVPEETKRFLTNISQMKDGEMTIAIENPELQKKLGQSEFKVSEMTDTVAQELMKYQKEFKAMSPEDIVRQQANAVQNLMKDVNYILGIMRIQGAETGDAAVKALFGMDSKDMGTMLSNQGDKGSDFAGAFIKDKMEGVRAILDQANESANKIKESQQEQNKSMESQSNTTQAQTITIKSGDSAMGAYQRQLQSNPQYWADLMKSDPRGYTT
tara:strand:- start:529 stop:2334 length:1806 start_codon:yes stop_codon:yes gene_type:complete